MVKDNKNGLIKVIILESLKKVRNMDKVNTFGMMDLIMKVNGIKERFMVKVFIFGSMVVNMMENLLMVLDRVLVKWLMLIKIIMKVIFFKIIKKVMVF